MWTSQIIINTLLLFEKILFPFNWEIVHLNTFFMLKEYNVIISQLVILVRQVCLKKEYIKF